MSDIERLMAAFESGDLLRPSADGPGLVDLANAIASVMGSDGVPLGDSARRIAGLINGAEHLVLVAVDGLGMDAVRSLGHDAFIPGHVKMQLQSVFPTSTPVAFTSLATGRWPSGHGVIGWDAYVPEGDCVATIIHFVRRSDGKNLSKLGVSPQQLYPVPSTVGGFCRDSLSLLPKDLVNSEYSTYVAGGTPQRGYDTLARAVNTAVQRVLNAKRPTFTYLYTPIVDSTAHEYGASHEKTLSAALQVDREVARLVEGLPDRAVVVLTADHGLLDTDEQLSQRIEPDGQLLECVVGEPWGDKRVANFRVRPGDEGRFERLFKERFGDLFYLIGIDEAEGLELYGPGKLSTVTRSRLGSHIALSAGADILSYPFATTQEEKRMVSHHSGLSLSEMLVPLAVVEA